MSSQRPGRFYVPADALTGRNTPFRTDNKEEAVAEAQRRADFHGELWSVCDKADHSYIRVKPSKEERND